MSKRDNGTSPEKHNGPHSGVAANGNTGADGLPNRIDGVQATMNHELSSILTILHGLGKGRLEMFENTWDDLSQRIPKGVGITRQQATVVHGPERQVGRRKYLLAKGFNAFRLFRGVVGIDLTCRYLHQQTLKGRGDRKAGLLGAGQWCRTIWRYSVGSEQGLAHAPNKVPVKASSNARRGSKEVCPM